MKNLEKLIEETVIPEMEYVPTGAPPGRKRGNVTVDEIPEVVLPKTKTEVFLEAKVRLTQKTKAVSKRSNTADPPKTTGKRKIGKTVQPEIAAVTETPDRAESKQIKYRRQSLRKPSDEPVWVGSPDDIVPFSWRFPLVKDMPRPSKLYRQTVDVTTDRKWLLPVISRKD